MRLRLPSLREWREKRGLTQQELANRIGSARDTISKWETGERGAQPTNAQRLADVLKVEVRDLTSQPLREWALVVPEEEFDRWIESANLDQVLTINGELSAAAREEEGGSARHRYIVSRISKVVDRFNKIAGPFELVETSRSRKEKEEKAATRAAQDTQENVG
jgi:transcriptional regulator with XRE-family HTH domain